MNNLLFMFLENKWHQAHNDMTNQLKSGVIDNFFLIMASNQSTLQEIVQVGNCLADGKPFLFNWEFFPVFASHGPGHPGADLTGIQSWLFPNDGEGLINAPVVMLFNLADAVVDIHIIFAMGRKRQLDIQ